MAPETADSVATSTRFQQETRNRLAINPALNRASATPVPKNRESGAAELLLHVSRGG